MKQVNVKKLLLPNLPYLFIGLFATKLGEAWRLTPGPDFSAKVLHLMDGFAAAFQSFAPSFHPIDLCVGVACAVALRLAVYVKGKNAQEIPQGRGVRLGPMGKHRRTSSPTSTRISREQHHSDADGAAYHEQPPEAAEVRPETRTSS